MTFQYFFFDTYVGYFLQALPIALLVSAVYGFIRFRNDRETALRGKALSCVFVCYIAGLICLVIGLDLMGVLWYRLLYHMDPGRDIRWFSGDFDFAVDIHIGRESVGNFLMFLPFGVLHPLAQRTPIWKKTLLTGFVTVIAIEVLQPVFGRAFDMNDVILNTLGIIISATAFFGSRTLCRRNHPHSPT